MWQAIGKYHKAIAYYKSEIKLRQNALGATNVRVAVSMIHLAGKDDNNE